MRTFNILVASILLITAFCGCTTRTTAIKTVRISDPDSGVSLDVPVQANGKFSQELKKDNVEFAASGSISDVASSHSVALVYERRRGLSVEKIETTFTANSDAEIPVGKNPSNPEQSIAENSLANVTFKLLKGQ